MRADTRVFGQRVCVAPMMGWTDRYGRFFLRQINGDVPLYTEMVTADALIHGPRARLLAFDAVEHPVALQVAGADPAKLAEAARMGADAGYDEINLNVGCPSSRVQSGGFGACMMADPDLVARCVAAMADAADVAVSVKHRLGIDDQAPWDSVRRFVATVADAGCRHFIVHARKAVLGGLSPKDNRTVPPLDHGVVYRLKEAFADLRIVTNGGVTSVAEARAHLAHVDGVMIGRAATADPFMLAAFDGGAATRHEVVARMLPYIDAEVGKGTPLVAMTRPMLGLFNGRRGARAWRRMLTEDARAAGAGADLVAAAATMVADDEVLAA